MQINISNNLSTQLSLDITITPGPAPGGRVIRELLGPGGSVDVGDRMTLQEVNKNDQLQSLQAAGTITIEVVEQSADLFSVESQFNKLRNDVAAAMVAAVEAGATAATVPYHKCNPASITVEGTADAAVTLATVLTLANSLRPKVIDHLASYGDVGAHRAASAAAVAAPIATDQGTANTLLTELKADFNTHLIEAGVHMVNDATNTIVAADATNLATSITLANAVKAAYNAHIAAANALDSLPMGST